MCFWCDFVSFGFIPIYWTISPNVCPRLFWGSWHKNMALWYYKSYHCYDINLPRTNMIKKTQNGDLPDKNWNVLFTRPFTTIGSGYWKRQYTNVGVFYVYVRACVCVCVFKHVGDFFKLIHSVVLIMNFLRISAGNLFIFTSQTAFKLTEVLCSAITGQVT